MKIVFTILACLLNSSMISAQDVELNSVQHFNIQSGSTMRIYLDTTETKIEIERTKSKNLEVDFWIGADARNKRIITILYKSGRYKLNLVQSGGLYILMARGKKNPVFVKGSRVHEKLRYLIKVPERVEYSLEIAPSPSSNTAQSK